MLPAHGRFVILAPIFRFAPAVERARMSQSQRDNSAGRARAEARPFPLHETFMRQAIEQARTALHIGEVPIGAVLVADGQVVAQGFNQPIHHVDPTAHAEIVALRQAAKTLGNYRLGGTTLYVTVEPCLMCVGALVNARVSAVVYGVAEPKWGALQSILRLDELRVNHRFEVVGPVLEAECRRLMVDFFKYRRDEA
jgi:tRNA(adenine34) deaminase